MSGADACSARVSPASERRSSGCPAARLACSCRALLTLPGRQGATQARRGPVALGLLAASLRHGPARRPVQDGHVQPFSVSLKTPSLRPGSHPAARAVRTLCSTISGVTGVPDKLSQLSSHWRSGRHGEDLSWRVGVLDGEGQRSPVQSLAVRWLRPDRPAIGPAVDRDATAALSWHGHRRTLPLLTRSQGRGRPQAVTIAFVAELCFGSRRSLPHRFAACHRLNSSLLAKPGAG